MSKKIISLLHTFALLISVCIPASANELPSGKEDATPIIIPENGMNDEHGATPFSLQMPSQADVYDLRSGSYSVTLTVVGNSRLYTNKVFRPNDEQRLYASVNVRAKSGTTKFSIGYYDVTAGCDFGLPYVIDGVGTKGTEAYIYAYEMNPSHVYAIYYISVGAAATGTGSVYHK